MANQRLTDRSAATSSAVGDQVHIVRHNTSYRMKTSLINATGQSSGIVGNATFGSGVIWVSGLDYYCFCDIELIDSITYNIPVADTVTLSNGHATLDRFDVFAVQVNTATEPATMSIVVVEGTPASTPLVPSLDLTTQVQIGLRLVPAAETTDGTTNIDTIYDDNAGTPTEWANTTLTTSGDLDVTTDPYSGTKNFLTPAITGSDSVSWTDTATKVFNGANEFQFAFRTVISNNAKMQIKLINSSTSNYWLKTLKADDLSAFVINEPADLWYPAQVQLSDFAPSSVSQTEYDRIEITFKGINQFELDKIEIQGDLIQSEPTSRPDDRLLQAGNLGATLVLDLNSYEGWKATLTEALTLSIINGKFKVVTVTLTGNFAITYPASSTVVGDTYDGTVWNKLVIEYIDATDIFITVTNYV